jgi:hypothetical protein
MFKNEDHLAAHELLTIDQLDHVSGGQDDLPICPPKPGTGPWIPDNLAHPVPPPVHHFG